MDCVVWFVVGLIVGGSIGASVIAICAASGRIND